MGTLGDGHRRLRDDESEGRLFTSVVEDDIAYTLYLIERMKSVE